MTDCSVNVNNIFLFKSNPLSIPETNHSGSESAKTTHGMALLHISEFMFFYGHLGGF